MNKRNIDKVDDANSLSPVPVSDVTPRKKVTATIPTAAGASPGGKDRLRKKQRLQSYYTEMATLNNSFAQFTKRAEHELRLQIESKSSSEKIPPMSTSFTEEANQYILKAHAIKQTYFPPTGNLLTFGANECGQLAQHEDIGSRMRPTVVLSSVRNIGVTQIACGALHNILLTDLGKVLSWGCNDEGSLGAYETSTAYAPMEVLGFIPASRELGTNLLPAQYTWTDLKHSKSDSDFKDPTKISKMFGKYGERIVSISSGDTQCLALSENGRVHMWGAYKDTEGMAWGDVPPKDDPRRYPDYVVDLEALEEDRIADPNTFAGVRGKRHWPVHVWQLGGKASQISCGFAFNAAVVEKDVGGIKKSVCITWGLGQNGELSRPVTKDLKMPKGTFDDLGEKEYSLAMAKNPYMKYNVDTVEEDYMMPKEVVWADGNSDRIVEKVVCGGYHLLIIAKDAEDGRSQLYSSGLNNYGQCGHHKGTVPDVSEEGNIQKLTKIESLNHVEISQMSAGEHFSIVLDSSGTKLFGIGRICSGQLGHTVDQPKPGFSSVDPIPIYLEYDSNGNPIENPVITRISSGGSHTFALTENGDCYSWGYGVMGALGVGKDLDRDCLFRPKKIPVTYGVNTTRLMKGLCPVKATVQMADGGAQHSAMVATLEEVDNLPAEDIGVEEIVREKKEKLAKKKREEQDQKEQEENSTKRLRLNEEDV